MINITRGQITNTVLSDKLVNFFEFTNEIDGNLFLGYPILPTMDNKIAIDALLISKEYGIIAFLFYDGVKKIDYEEAQDEVYAVLLSKLAKEKSLIKRGKLLIHLDVVTYAPNISESKVQENDGFTVCNNDNALSEYFKI